MANGIAIGGLAQGLSQGLNQGFSLASAIDKDKRDQELFALQKEKLEMERDEARRKKAMQDQISRGLQEIDARLTGGTIGGEATDEFGVDLGKLVYKNPTEAKASGLNFKQGTTVEQKPEQLTDNEVSRLKAAVFQKARIDHNFMDEDSFEKARKVNKELKREGFQEAYDYFAQTGDSVGALELYNKMGGQKAPAGAFMRREVDPVTGVEDIVVYAPGQGGQPQRITSRFEFHLANMPDELVKYGLNMKKEKFVQGEANKRVAMQEAGQDRRSKDKIAADRATAQEKRNQDMYGELYKMYTTQVNGIYKDAFASMNAEQKVATQTLILQRAERLMRESNALPGAALNEAMQFTLSRQPQPDKK